MVTEAMLTKVCQGGCVKMDGLVKDSRGSQVEQVSMFFWGCSGFTRVIAVVGQSGWPWCGHSYQAGHGTQNKPFLYFHIIIKHCKIPGISLGHTVFEALLDSSSVVACVTQRERT